MNRLVKKTLSIKLMLFALVVIETSPLPLMAIPAFARKYHTACATCHSNWPELNDFGRAFKINGFKFPKDDDDFVKEPPLVLGAEAQKDNFPHSIYPGELPLLPIAFRYSGYFSYNTPQPDAVAAETSYLPKTELFQPNTFTVLAAGSFGPSLAFWIDDDLSAPTEGWETDTSRRTTFLATICIFLGTISMSALGSLNSISRLLRREPLI
jgi:hypothetical protein